MMDYSGATPTSTGTATFQTPVLQGTYSTATAWWELNDGGSSTTATDSIGGPAGPNTATLNGSAAWTTDTNLTQGTKTVAGHPALLPANPTSTVLSLDGTTGYAATTNPVVNTSGSYTVSLWVNLNQNYNTNDYYTALCQRDTSGARCGFYLQYSPAYKGWALVMPGTDAANTLTYFHAGTGVTPTGQWTHLVGVYNATTGAMNLYVNGNLAGTDTDTTPWTTPAGGPLLIGAADGGNTPGSVADFPGEISDVHVYNTALSPAAATSIGDNPPPLTGLN
ncbi:LamG domain-containing protein [Streptacidiphilus albus]|uniref:LamG domain-containing protein n=1 Tax=Streptacidiphilus albus TaxID=105425 RepID=UPI0005A8D340|nr:LamG domain-containing protein [Streptacidiphilus albus]